MRPGGENFFGCELRLLLAFAHCGILLIQFNEEADFEKKSAAYCKSLTLRGVVRLACIRLLCCALATPPALDRAEPLHQVKRIVAHVTTLIVVASCGPHLKSASTVPLSSRLDTPEADIYMNAMADERTFVEHIAYHLRD